jgi:hypothetical protein
MFVTRNRTEFQFRLMTPGVANVWHSPNFSATSTEVENLYEGQFLGHPVSL